MENNFTDVWKQLAITNKNLAQALSRTFLDKKEVRSQQSSLYGTNKALIESVQTTAANADAAMAENISRLFAGANGAEGQANQTAQVAADAHVAVGELSDEVTAKIGPSGSITSEVSGHTASIAQLDGYAAGKWAIGVTVDSLGRRSVAGIVLFTDSNDTSSFAINANNFYVTFPDAAGGDPVPVYTIANVNGVAKSVLRGDMFVDGGVITRMIQAGAITTVTLDALSVNTSKLAINSVGIDQIIANAVSNVKPFYNNEPVTITSANSDIYVFNGESVDIRSGTAIVTICGQWIKPLGGNSITDAKVVLQLNINGTNVRRFYWDCVIEGGAYRLYQPFTIKHVQTGLAAGTNTFTLRNVKATDDSASNAFADLYYCTMLVEDFRR